MTYWEVWLIVAAIGLVIGFLVHAFIRFAQGASILATVLAGIVGAFAAAYFITPYVNVPNESELVMRFVWAAIGAIVLSIIVEFMFAGSRRGRVVTS